MSLETGLAGKTVIVSGAPPSGSSGATDRRIIFQTSLLTSTGTSSTWECAERKIRKISSANAGPMVSTPVRSRRTFLNLSSRDKALFA
jgi:hypothetical protein